MRMRAYNKMFKYSPRLVKNKNQKKHKKIKQIFNDDDFVRF